jgi:CRP/FNR family transcriptional regulator, cyclic AMP receptor protein
MNTATSRPGIEQQDLDARGVAQSPEIQLRRLPLLEGVDEAVVAKIEGLIQVRTADRGQPILHKGGPGDHLLFLFSGRLQAVDITEDGREIGLSFLMPGDYFGELSVIDGLPRSATVVTCEPSTYALLSRPHALDLMHNNPLVAQRMFKRLAVGIRRASNFRTILGIPHAFQRVYALLDYLSQSSPGGLVVIERLPTQQEISIMINTSRETVSRALQVLIQRGVVEKDMKRLIVRQPDILRQEMTSVKHLAEESKRPRAT